MTLFRYHARDLDGKEVSGTVESADTASAVRSLEDLHLVSIVVSEASRARTQEPATAPPPLSMKVTYVFEGKDPNGVLRRGTIQAMTKRAAFDRLKTEQNLLLSMLSPMNQKAPPNDAELELWQSAPSVPLPPPEKKETVSPPRLGGPASFTLPDSPKNSSVPSSPLISIAPVAAAPTMDEPKAYYPLISTLRLYAGWLLAWYALFVILGYYSLSREMPLSIPFVVAFSSSSLIFTFTVATFLFLLFSSLHRAMHGRLLSAVAFTVIGITLFVGVRMSI